jgi:hypothetical protein
MPTNIQETLARLAAAEEQFLGVDFLAPALPGSPVQVRIAGVVCSLKITPSDYTGWGVFRASSHTEAKLIRPAKLSERRQYLELFPLVRMLLVQKQGNDWLAMPAHQGDSRLRIEGVAPVHFVEDGQLFDAVETRFDGQHFWFASPDNRWDASRGKYLRQQIDLMTPPKKIERSGLTQEEWRAYKIEYDRRYEASEAARLSREEKRLRSAVEHAGATFEGYVERGDVYTVNYRVDGQRHSSAVSKHDLTVQVAGICLSGEDAKFDLHSLVGVIREGNAEY